MWPRSAPDYRWPKELLSARSTSRRWLLAAAFHLAHAAGRFACAIRRNAPAALVIRTDGIGDAVLAEPMLASLARQFAGCELHLWAPAATCELTRGSPHFHHRFPVPRGFKEGNLAYFRSLRWRVALGYRLGRWRFQTAAYLVESPEPLGNWLVSCVRADHRWYNPGNTENQFPAQREKTAAIATKIVSPEGNSHELTRNAAMVRQWGDDVDGQCPRVHLDDAARSAAEVQLSTWREMARPLGAAKVVGLMSTGSAAIKRYPLSACIALVSRLWREQRVLCALLGGPDDATAIADLAASLGDVPHLHLARPLDLLAMAALLSGLDGLISTDTGLAHIALAQDVPTVVLCGGSHPGRFFPWPIPRQALVLNQPMSCAGCLGRCQLKEAECLTRIDPGEIAAAMTRLLSGRKTPLRIAG